MSFRNNGRKRDLKYVLSSLFLLCIGLICLYFAASVGWKIGWVATAAAILFFSLIMFKNANEI